MFLRRLFEHKHNGFYIDVGAHHPKRFSNTYFFYKNGWKGINIDAMPNSMALFKKIRPRDINLEIGVSNTSEMLDYYIFNEPALNSFSLELSSSRTKSGGMYYVKEIIKVRVCPLRDILAQHAADKEIDFLSIDVEGFDLQVLLSNDWSRYRPSIVLVEILKSSLHDLDTDPIVNLMREQGYAVYGKQVNTVFFLDIKTAAL